MRVPAMFAVGVVLGLAGACNYTHELSAYCTATGNCSCIAANCCVLEGKECVQGTADCCSGMCFSGRCLGGSDAGNVGNVDAGNRDAGVIGFGVIIPGRTNMTAGTFDFQNGCTGNDYRPKRWEGGSFVEPPCCTPAGPVCTAVGGSCALPGNLSGLNTPCCFCDQNCDQDGGAYLCPYVTPSPIDVPQLMNENGIPSGGCGSGRIIALGGCCHPNSADETCQFEEGGNPVPRFCSLDPAPGGLPCCFVVAADPGGTLTVIDDCRVSGSCECNAGGCGSAPGAVCVDVVR